MGFYRKKPVVIEAIQFDGSAQSADEISRKWSSNVWPECNEHGEFTGRLVCQTPEGRIYAIAQDYVISGVKGERYPCKPDIFAQTYEPVRSAESIQWDEIDKPPNLS